METTENSILKIYASTTDKIGLELLYEHIVLQAKKQKIAGVTVYRGIMGFGLSNNHIESSRFWELADKLPVVIEMVDKTEILENFYNDIENDLLQVPKGCLVTLQPVEIKLQKTGISRK
jgi:PII-like signaling protein